MPLAGAYENSGSQISEVQFILCCKIMPVSHFRIWQGCNYKITAFLTYQRIFYNDDFNANVHDIEKCIR